MERFCITLDQAKRLEELGAFVKFGEPIFSWFSFRNESSPKNQWNIVHSMLENSYEKEDFQDREYLKDLKVYPAYSVGELGEILPDFYSDCFCKSSGEWVVFYPEEGISTISTKHPTEAQAKGTLLIHLLENNLL